jgi:hypothetical protein
MKSFVITFVLLCVVSVELEAQVGTIASCPTADAEVGPPPRRVSGISRRYERISDTTQLEVRHEVVRLVSSSPDASFRLITAFEGENEPTTEPGTILQIVVAIDRNTGSTVQQSGQDQARMTQAEVANVLIDRSTRIRLNRINHTAEVQQGNLLRDSRVVETATFAVSPDDLLQMVQADDRVEIQAGPVRGGFNRGHMRAAREMYRLSACWSSGDEEDEVSDNGEGEVVGS